jgi:hypothetical protein
MVIMKRKAVQLSTSGKYEVTYIVKNNDFTPLNKWMQKAKRYGKPVSQVLIHKMFAKVPKKIVLLQTNYS